MFCWLVSYFGWRHLPDALNQIHTSTHTHARHGKSICANIPAKHATRNTHGASPKRLSHITNIKNKCNGSPKNLFFFLVCHTYAYSQLSLHPHKTKKTLEASSSFPFCVVNTLFLALASAAAIIQHTSSVSPSHFPPAETPFLLPHNKPTQTHTHGEVSCASSTQRTHTHTHPNKTMSSSSLLCCCFNFQMTTTCTRQTNELILI